MLLFYDAPVSANTFKVRLLLRQLAIQHEVVRLDLLKGEARTAGYRKVNPFGRVPFIVDGGFALGESNAILLYLARGSRLLPGDAREQVLERHLAAREWFVGDSYSVADIALFAYTHLGPEAGHDLAKFPAVSAWLARVRAQ